jgi:predicted dehydrogenase
MTTKTVVGIIGCGFVADYYMATKYAYPEFEIRGVYDIDCERLKHFCQFYKLKACSSEDQLLCDPEVSIIINLTNPHSHYEVSLRALQAGKNVYSEKPLAMNYVDAKFLSDFATDKQLFISSAPCNCLGRSAKTFKKAIEMEVVGKPLLVYAELEDGLVSAMPYKKWYSASGAPWPYRDEFEVGCTLEHSGYYIGWLVAAFGEVESVTAFSTALLTNKVAGEAPLNPDNTADMSIGVLKFKSGVVARLSTSIIAQRDYSIRVFGDRGVLKVKDCWNNGDSVIYQNYINIRRRTLLNPFVSTMKPEIKVPVYKMEHSKTKMDFLLGVKELADAVTNKSDLFLTNLRSLHINEVALALQYAGERSSTYIINTKLSD